MNIIARGTIVYYLERFPAAKTALSIWYAEFSKQKFKNFNELKAVYGNASIVTNNRVIFNIKGKDYRLIVSINFQKSAAYVIWFGPHSAYDKIDTVTVNFKIK